MNPVVQSVIDSPYADAVGTAAVGLLLSALGALTAHLSKRYVFLRPVTAIVKRLAILAVREVEDEYVIPEKRMYPGKLSRTRVEEAKARAVHKLERDAKKLGVSAVASMGETAVRRLIDDTVLEMKHGGKVSGSVRP
jgi:hypothetical protein